MATIPTLVFGGATIAEDGSFTTAAEVSSLLETLKSKGITQLDTAQSYGGGTSEQLIGQGKGVSEFLIDTKHVGGFAPGSSTRKEVFDRAIASLERLGVTKVRSSLIYQTSLYTDYYR
jgi:aflatoxin B1 aldehyde reductase